ncbi:hypothetical protein H6P81_017478 [Aristolochia fimbriata]|uniref:Uncharacterized protein n=1 Tax=Aristolochia fimbriata TaxID=158543 RepID=A0AAV7E017_ARIFI|nr:hypothetical protein H6P81_017478 [Aristolochia fimbriata]
MRSFSALGRRNFLLLLQESRGLRLPSLPIEFGVSLCLPPHSRETEKPVFQSGSFITWPSSLPQYPYAIETNTVGGLQNLFTQTAVRESHLLIRAIRPPRDTPPRLVGNRLFSERMEGDSEESIEVRRSGGQLTSEDGEYSFAKAHSEIFFPINHVNAVSFYFFFVFNPSV